MKPHFCFCLCALLSACVARDELLEPQPSGMDVATPLRAPVVFVRDDPGASVVGRDFTYFGPVEMDAAGSRQVVLWVGLGSSIDRGARPHPLHDATGIVVHLDAVSVQLPLSPWPIEDAPFATRVPLVAAFEAPIGRGLLSQIADSRRLEIEWLSARKRLYRYAHWRGEWPDWREIDADTSVGLRVQVWSGEPGAD